MPVRLEEAFFALRVMPEELERRVSGLNDAQLRFKPATDVFSVL